MQGSGRSIHDLADELRGRVANDAGLVAKVDRVVMEELGSDYALAGQERFDRDGAMAGLKLYSAASVPCVSMPLPNGVLGTRMTVDLDFATSLPTNLFQPGSALPRLIFG